jgi:hypothetical protein
MIAVCGVLFVVALFVAMAIAIILAPNLFSAALLVGEGSHAWDNRRWHGFNGFFQVISQGAVTFEG